MPNGASRKVILITGPPGAGKSTALLALDRVYRNLGRFGVRDYGLKLAAVGDPLGLEMRDALLRQERLTNELVLREFIHFLDNLPAAVRFVAVEGYPRDTQQCDDLLRAASDWGAQVAGFVVVEIPDSVARERVANRRLCLACGATTDSSITPSCPDCGGAIIRRRDDDAAEFERRLAEFHNMNRELSAYFRERSLLRVVDGMLPAKELRELLRAALFAEDKAELAE
ncbi:adenylate kinase family protein [Streptomyces sp. NPDC059396]|uniref:adenylate kinase family protein n=1 Tax=Streptomyces sp. NPDC059396 TaxID=3346819 RepID=UPI0036BC7C13